MKTIDMIYEKVCFCSIFNAHALTLFLSARRVYLSGARLTP